MMRVGHYRPVHVKSAEAQLIRTTLQARRQIVTTLLQIQGSIRGLLRISAVAARAGTTAHVRTEFAGQALGTSLSEGCSLYAVDDDPWCRTNHRPRLQGNSG